MDAVNRERNFYSGDFTIPSLRPATVYLARVASKNAYGYNEFGSEFKFATKGAGPCFSWQHWQITPKLEIGTL